MQTNYHKDKEVVDQTYEDHIIISLGLCRKGLRRVGYALAGRWISRERESGGIVDSKNARIFLGVGR